MFDIRLDCVGRARINGDSSRILGLRWQRTAHSWLSNRELKHHHELYIGASFQNSIDDLRAEPRPDGGTDSR